MTLTDPSDGSERSYVECVHCGEHLPYEPTQASISDHHAKYHVKERYNPAWYDMGEGNPFDE